MKKIVKDIEIRRVEVPVMRNGKPTKKMKTTWVTENIEKEIEVNQVTFFNKKYYYPVEGGQLYNESGEYVTGLFTYGPMGQTLHRHAIKVNDKGKIVSQCGYSGVTFKGAQAFLKSFEN